LFNLAELAAYIALAATIEKRRKSLFGLPGRGALLLTGPDGTGREGQIDLSTVFERPARSVPRERGVRGAARQACSES